MDQNDVVACLHRRHGFPPRLRLLFRHHGRARLPSQIYGAGQNLGRLATGDRRATASSYRTSIRRRMRLSRKWADGGLARSDPSRRRQLLLRRRSRTALLAKASLDCDRNSIPTITALISVIPTATSSVSAVMTLSRRVRNRLGFAAESTVRFDLSAAFQLLIVGKLFIHERWANSDKSEPRSTRAASGAHRGVASDVSAFGDDRFRARRPSPRIITAFQEPEDVFPQRAPARGCVSAHASACRFQSEASLPS